MLTSEQTQRRHSGSTSFPLIFYYFHGLYVLLRMLLEECAILTVGFVKVSSGRDPAIRYNSRVRLLISGWGGNAGERYRTSHFEEGLLMGYVSVRHCVE